MIVSCIPRSPLLLMSRGLFLLHHKNPLIIGGKITEKPAKDAAGFIRAEELAFGLQGKGAGIVKIV